MGNLTEGIVSKESNKKSLWEYVRSKKDAVKKGAALTLATITTGTLLYVTPPKLYAQEAKPKEVATETKTEQKEEKPARFMGTLYAEGSAFWWPDFNEHPASLNAMLGYNILKNKEGNLLLPYVRLNVKANKSEFYWDNRADISIGAAYRKGPFIVGIEGGYRESFKKQGKDGGFGRAWGAFWNKAEAKPLAKNTTFPLTPGSIQYAEFEANTLTRDITGNARLEGYVTALNIKGVKVEPYVAGKVAYDTKKYPWERYAQGSGGIKISKGPIALFLETGYKNSFEKEGLDGHYNAVMIGIWIPLSIK
ncbi:MAG: hypothetical protein QXR60_02440 [Candidatus Nanoarchaeia archaeon]